MIKLFEKKDDCCGCTACKNICPMKAINMEPDHEGFLYPIINNKLCIECGLCKKVCSFKNGYITSNNLCSPITYAVKHKLDEIRYNSSSGGLFTALSDEILAQGGIIYGVGLDENLRVCHQRATDKSKRDLFRGSKYVQSDMGHILKSLEEDLREGRNVLFTGTPCQVAGAKGYLDKKNVITSNLILCDIICHGTPSPKMFSDYLLFCEKKEGKKIVNHIFRSKVNGWHNHTELNIFENGKVDGKSYTSQLFKHMFHSHMILRPSCHNCIYTNINRPSDITIADFWGIENTHPDFDDNKGISLAMINTERGLHVFNAIKDRIIFKELNISKYMQPNMKKPTEKSAYRELFWNDYKDKGFEYVIKKYFNYGLKGDIKRFIANILIKVKLYSYIKKKKG